MNNALAMLSPELRAVILAAYRAWLRSEGERVGQLALDVDGTVS